MFHRWFARMPEWRESLPHYVLSPTSLSRSPLLHLGLLSENDASGIDTSVRMVGFWLLICLKLDKGASSGRGYFNVAIDVPKSR